jgi:hypothetical protein
MEAIQFMRKISHCRINWNISSFLRPNRLYIIPLILLSLSPKISFSLLYSLTNQNEELSYMKAYIQYESGDFKSKIYVIFPEN